VVSKGLKQAQTRAFRSFLVRQKLCSKVQTAEWPSQPKIVRSLFFKTKVVKTADSKNHEDVLASVFGLEQQPAFLGAFSTKTNR